MNAFSLVTLVFLGAISISVPANAVSSNFVGIGTTAPSYLLDIHPVANIGATTLRVYGGSAATSDNAQIRFAGQKDGELWAIGTDIAAGGSTGDFEFYNLGAAGGTAGTKLAILGNGNVGVGTTNPLAPLTVYGTGSGGVPASSGTADATMNFRASRGTVGVDIGILDSGVGYIQDRNFAALGTTYSLALQPTGGNVGIGTTSPTQVLEVSGTVKATSLLLTSDRRKKTAIRSLDPADSLNRVMQLRPVSFRWKKDNSVDEGLIAQDIQTVLPELVDEDPKGELSVKYTSLVGRLVGAIQELKSTTDALKAENETLRKSVQRLIQESKQQALKR